MILGTCRLVEHALTLAGLDMLLSSVELSFIVDTHLIRFSKERSGIWCATLEGQHFEVVHVGGQKH